MIEQNSPPVLIQQESLLGGDVMKCGQGKRELPPKNCSISHLVRGCGRMLSIISAEMIEIFSYLTRRFDVAARQQARVIPWSSPVPSFGDVSCSQIATVGLNPSNKEFVDDMGEELAGGNRRFHTLNSLGISTWLESDEEHHYMMTSSCKNYFASNPYDRWFKELDFLMSGTDYSYYSSLFKACHLDIIPFATSCKWAELKTEDKKSLVLASGDVLGHLVKESPLRILILNGSSVVSLFQMICDSEFSCSSKKEWDLPRTKENVPGYAYQGSVKTIAGVPLGREIMVLGYNHNIQSSFGVTRQVKTSIMRWISKSTKEVFPCS